MALPCKKVAFRYTRHTTYLKNSGRARRWGLGLMDALCSKVGVLGHPARGGGRKAEPFRPFGSEECGMCARYVWGEPMRKSRAIVQCKV